MLKRRLIACSAAALAFTASAQEYPSRTIRVVVALAPGGPTPEALRAHLKSQIEK